MTLFNRLLGALVGAILYPFQGMHPLVGLSVVSLLAAVLLLWVVKKTSDQKSIEQVKRRVQACIYEIRLYNDDLRTMLRAQAELMRHNLRYLGLSMVPMFWSLPVLLPIMVQLQFQYGYRGLEPAKPTLLSVELKDGWALTVPATPGGSKPQVTLELPDGIEAETPAVWIPSANRLEWRLKAVKAGDYRLTVRSGAESQLKSVRVAGGLGKLSPLRLEPGFVNALLYPAEAPLPAASPLRSIGLAYPEREIGGWHWMWIFCGLSLVFAFALKGKMGVTL